MRKRLWVVTFSAEVVVVASDESEAYEAAYSEYQDIRMEAEHIEPLRHMPSGWSEESLPYGSEDDTETIGVLVRQGAAPEYAAGATLRELSEKG